MKRLGLILLIASACLFISTTIQAGEGKSKTKKLNLTFEIIEANYLEGLKSDNSGLRASCAYFLGEMKSEKAVLPLMKMLRSEKDGCNRQMAALSLIKIGDPRGVFLVKRTAIYDDCPKVRAMCERFYNAFLFNSLLSNKDI
jgi:RNase P/RNase MRP subunit POP5